MFAPYAELLQHIVQKSCPNIDAAKYPVAPTFSPLLWLIVNHNYSLSTLIYCVNHTPALTNYTLLKPLLFVFCPIIIHAIWQLPADDARFDLRWRIIKANFSRYFEANIERSTSKAQKREKGIWQRRYWEHLIRDERDLNQHIDYVHANPVKHGHVTNAKDWPYSSFHRYVQEGVLPVDWMGSMDDAKMPLGE